MKRLFSVALAAAFLLGGLTATVAPAADSSDASAAQILDQASADGQYTFLLFYKEDNQATRAMAQTLKQGVAKRQDQATTCFVSVTDPAEQATVKRFGVSRAPLPFTLAVAPNGAVTGLFSQKISDQNIAGAFVTSGMAQCMKSMQDRKLVLVCVQTSARSATPAGVQDFQADPEFKDRVAVISVQANDPAEAPFLKQMEINPAQVKTSSIVFMAPPAVLVGKFSSNVTMAEMAAALHKAGKCCDDPNCKHNHGPQVTKKPGAARN